jgi:hypothetical protein
MCETPSGLLRLLTQYEEHVATLAYDPVTLEPGSGRSSGEHDPLTRERRALGRRDRRWPGPSYVTV